MRRTEFLNPTTKLVDAVVAWLCQESRVRLVNGARSLAHLMVVVPTAQSGRNLRLALAQAAAAKGWGGILPPVVVQPMQLVMPAQNPYREATKTELAAVFQSFVSQQRSSILSTTGEIIRFTHLFTPAAFEDMTARFALLDQLNDIWRILAGGGLLMRDILDPARCAAAVDFLNEHSLGDEVARWEELAELETAFFAALHERGLCHPVESVQMACSAPAAISDQVEEVVLPALSDPIRILPKILEGQRDELRVTVLLHVDEAEQAKFDDWGRPRREAWTGSARPVLSNLRDEDIVCCSTETALAQTVVADFPVPGSELELPAVALCDEKLFPELSAAFLNRGYELHNPERHRLIQSSLGQLVRALAELYVERPEGIPWRTVVALFRSDDMLRALEPDPWQQAVILEGLDVAQNNFIPDFLPPQAAFPDVPIDPAWKTDQVAAFRTCAQKLLTWRWTARTGSLVTFVRNMLGQVYCHRREAGEGAREFYAACAALRDMLGRLESPIVQSLELPEKDLQALFQRELRSVEYSLDPDSPDSLKTEGWLELAWSRGDHLGLVGFHEGNVPDSVIGHPFIPDSLRAVLALTTNEDRLARDTWLLKEILASHASGAVKAYIARTNQAGDIKRPSRLLYLCSDADLPRRTKSLFGDISEVSVDRSRQVAPGWELQLMNTLSAPRTLSPSRIDTYIKCPFTYLLKCGLNMSRFEEKKELEANDFGTLVHLALELYARKMIARGANQLTHEEDIRDVFTREIFPELRVRYGLSRSLGIRLQFEALEGRIGLFARLQAEWAQEDWRIHAAEFKVENVKPFLEDGIDLVIHGTVDRIDRNLTTGKYRVIDYKTWDSVDKAKKHVYLNVSKDARQQALAERLKFPVIPATTTKTGASKNDAKRFASVQLPLYARCLEMLPGTHDYAGNIDDMLYLILGKDAENTKVYNDGLVEHRELALQTARQAIRGILANIFWPVGPTGEWKYDFADLFVTSPEKDLAESAWVAAQMEKVVAQ